MLVGVSTKTHTHVIDAPTFTTKALSGSGWTRRGAVVKVRCVVERHVQLLKGVGGVL